MTEQEETIIHAVLDTMLANLGRANYLPDVLSKKGFDDNKYITPILIRLQSEGLITQPNSSQTYTILPTAKAIDAARHEGGFKGYQASIKAQQQQEEQFRQEKSDLEKASSLATVSAAKSSASATKAAWVSAGIAVIAIIISFFLNNSLDATNAQVEALTKRVQALEAQAKQQRQHP